MKTPVLREVWQALASGVPGLRGMPYANYWLGDTEQGLEVSVDRGQPPPFCKVKWEYRDEMFHLIQMCRVVKTTADLKAAVKDCAAAVPLARSKDPRLTVLASVPIADAEVVIKKKEVARTPRLVHPILAGLQAKKIPPPPKDPF